MLQVGDALFDVWHAASKSHLVSPDSQQTILQPDKVKIKLFFLLSSLGGGGGGGGGWGGGKKEHTSLYTSCSPVHQNYMFLLLYSSRLFHRLKIGCFSGSLAELFLAPPIAALSVESRSVPVVVSSSRLLLFFNLWSAECTRCFLYFK